MNPIKKNAVITITCSFILHLEANGLNVIWIKSQEKIKIIRHPTGKKFKPPFPPRYPNNHIYSTLRKYILNLI